MPDHEATLKDLFRLTGDGIPEGQWSAAVSGVQMSAVKESLQKEAKVVGWSSISGEIRERVGDLLDIKVSSVLAAAWNKYRALSRALEASAASPEQSFLVPLAEHTVRSVHHPYVEIQLDGRPVGRVTFDIKLDILVQGIELVIRGGRVEKIRSGRCKGKGEIACQGATLISQDFGPIAIPGSI